MKFFAIKILLSRFLCALYIQTWNFVAIYMSWEMFGNGSSSYKHSDKNIFPN